MSTPMIDPAQSPEVAALADAAQQQMDNEPALKILLMIAQAHTTYLKRCNEQLCELQADTITLRQHNEDLKAAVAKASLQIMMLKQALEATEREIGHA